MAQSKCNYVDKTMRQLALLSRLSNHYRTCERWTGFSPVLPNPVLLKLISLKPISPNP